MNKSMMMAMATVLFVGAATEAADINRVIVRQQWPWSTDVRVDYELVNVTDPVDITVEAYNGSTKLDTEALSAAITGERYNISTSRNGVLTIDPIKAFGTSQLSLNDFRVELSVSPSPENMSEVLYKIFDLDDGSCEEITRCQILNGEKGSYVTDFSKIGSGFNTSLTNVLIWTEITNDVYKTSKLVMRKIPAKDVVWQCGSTDTDTGLNTILETPGWIKLTQDYFIGVFELTQGQYYRIAKDGFAPGVEPGINRTPSSFKGKPDSDLRPLENLDYNNIGESYGPYSTVRGYVHNNEMVYWPTNSYLRDVPKNRVCGILRAKYGIEFDIPTEAQWEFACRAGTTTSLYSGKETTAANAAELGWYGSNSGAETHPVGLLPPNAFGLYDMYGNVFEFTRNRGKVRVGEYGLPYTGGTSGTGASKDDPAVDPVGPTALQDGVMVVLRGGCWYSPYTWSNMRSPARINVYSLGQPSEIIGVRLVCPVGAQWSSH